MAGEMVRFPSNGSEAEGYLARPVAGKGPALIVIQEWWGLVPNIKDICDRFAGEGFVTLAPDLYHGAATSEPDEAGKLMMTMKLDQAANDLTGAVDYLVGREVTTGDTIGCVGYCMGGGLTLYLSSLKPEIGAAVVYYGVLPGAQPDFKNIQAAILGHYAENDQFASPAAARALEEQLKSLDKDVDFHIYPGTSHGFFNDTRAEVHNAGAAKLSWERTLAFFRKHLA